MNKNIKKSTNIYYLNKLYSNLEKRRTLDSNWWKYRAWFITETQQLNGHHAPPQLPHFHNRRWRSSLTFSQVQLSLSLLYLYFPHTLA